MTDAAQDPDVVDDLEAAEAAADATAATAEDEPPVEDEARRVDEEDAHGRVILDELRRAEQGGLFRHELAEELGLDEAPLAAALERLRDRGEVVEPEVDWFTVPSPDRRDTAEEDLPEAGDPLSDAIDRAAELDDEDEEESAPAPAAGPVGGGLPVRALIVLEAVFSAGPDESDRMLANRARTLGARLADVAGNANYQVVSVEAFDKPRKVKL